MENKIIGNWGEQKATEYLEKNGYEIIERNFNTYQGEVDIIAKDKIELIFVEVKTRQTNKYGRPVEAVNYYKQKHIKQVAKYYLYKNNIMDAYIRFDIIEVYKKQDECKINHIKNIM